jgi:hypothetical protein
VVPPGEWKTDASGRRRAVKGQQKLGVLIALGVMKRGFASLPEHCSGPEGGRIRREPLVSKVAAPWCREPVREGDLSTGCGPSLCCPRQGEHAEQTLSAAKGSRRGRKEHALESVEGCCCGLDVHAKTVS